MGTSMTPKTKTVGERIQAAREVLGWSKAKLGRAISVSGERIAAIERGPYQPSDDTVARIAEALEVSPLKLNPQYHGPDPQAPALQVEMIRKGQDWHHWVPRGANDAELLTSIGADRPMPIPELLSVCAEQGIAVLFRGDLAGE